MSPPLPPSPAESLPFPKMRHKTGRLERKSASSRGRKWTRGREVGVLYGAQLLITETLDVREELKSCLPG